MNTKIIAIALAFAATAAVAEENPAVAAARDANAAIGVCISAMSSGISQSNIGPDAKTLMLNDVPNKCRQGVVTAQVRQGPGTGEMVWDGVKFAVGLWAQYKGQALVWGTVSSMLSRQADSTDAAVTQGFQAANNGLTVTGTLAGQAVGKLPSPVWPSASHESVGSADSVGSAE
jgi:hypothetical protein